MKDKNLNKKATIIVRTTEAGKSKLLAESVEKKFVSLSEYVRNILKV